MPTGETTGGVESLAQQRNAELARSAGEKAAKFARELLVRHSDLLTAETVRQILDREFTRASEAALRARAEGRANDNASMAPGLTAFFTRRGAEGLREAANVEAAAPHLSRYAAAIQPVSDNETLFSLRLPRGTYGMGGGACQFYGHVEQQSEGEEYIARRDPIYMPYGWIARIEGDHGELWQNHHLKPDGTPKD